MLAPSYFDECVPPEVLQEHFIQFLSDRPRHLFAQAYICFQDVMTLLNIPALRDIVRKKFTALSTGTRKEGCVGAEFDTGTQDPGLLVDNADLFYMIFPEIAENIERVTIDTAVLYPRGAHWIDTLGKTKVTELSLWNMDAEFPLDDVLRGCPRLVTLVVSGKYSLSERHFAAIADRSPQVQFLELRGVPINARLDSFWPRFKELEDLSLSLESVPMVSGALQLDPIFDSIPDGCPKLRVLDVGDVQSYMFSTIVHLCTRIGRSLLELELTIKTIPADIVAAGLMDIRYACENIRVGLTSRAECLVPTMNALGKHAKSLQPTESMFTGPPQGLAAAASRCTQIKSLTLSLLDIWAPKFLKFILEGSLGRNLEELRLNIYPAHIAETLADSRSPALEVVANHTKNLMRFVLHGARPTVSLRSIADANRKLLGVVVNVDSKVYDIIEDTPDVVEDWLVSVVHDFLECCNELEDLVIEEEEAFETVIPSGHRIDRLDKLCATPGMCKAPVRVGRYFYDK